MAELHPIDPNGVFKEVPGLQAQVRGLKATADGIRKTATTVGAPLPIPDVNEAAKKILKKEKDKYVAQAKKEILILVVEAMSEFVAENPPPVNEIVLKINPMIDKLNLLIDKIHTAVKDLQKQLKLVNTAMAALLGVYIATKVISLIPVPTVGLGAGIGFSQFISICQEINSGIAIVLSKIATIAYAILSVILMF